MAKIPPFELQKTATEKIVVEVREWKGIRALDIRTYYLIGDEHSETWKPSREGVWISARDNIAADFIRFIVQNHEALLDEIGWTD